MGAVMDELAKDGLKAIFTSGGGGTVSAAVGSAAFAGCAKPGTCGTSQWSVCPTWQVLGMTFHSASQAAHFFGPAIGAVLVLAWIVKFILDISESIATG
jgi:hypothetical protein